LRRVFDLEYCAQKNFSILRSTSSNYPSFSGLVFCR
jgi:hypothetical protein